MATITKKKALSNFQWADQAKNDTQSNVWLIPTTPKLDTNSVIASQLNTPADIFKRRYANQWMTTPVSTTPATPAVSTPASPITQVDQTGKNTDILYQNNIPKGWTIDSLIAGLESKPTTTQTTTSWPTNQQNMDALTTNMATVAENAKKASDETKSILKYGAQQRDYQQELIKSQADTAQVRMDRQMADQTLQVDRAIADTDRISKRNIAMLEKVAALQGTGKSSGFGQWILNLKEDTIRTINRLKEDLDRAKTATGEEAKLLWENYNRNKEKIDNDFEYQFRDFTNRQTASIAELTTAWYDPVKVNKALDKIYEEAQYKTQELFTNYVNNYQTLNNETRLQSQEIRTQKEFENSIQKEFISQYIGYNGEKLGSQTLQSLKWYLDNGQISQNDYDLYSEMMWVNAVETLSQFGVVWEDDYRVISELLSKWYNPTEAVSFMIQNNPNRFNIETKALNEWNRQQQSAINMENLKTRNDLLLKWGGWASSWTWVAPTWSIVTHTQTWRKLDSAALPAFSSAYNELMTSWVGKWMVFAEWYRDQAQTIKAMWDRVGMPWASAAELRAAWHQIADVGKSDHETGMAIDVYANGSYWAPTAAQVAILNKNGWYQTAGAWDMWHFEYLWSKWQAQWWDLNTLWQYMKDNQQRWPWYSEEDVKAFNEKIDRFVKSWDKKWIALAFRTNLFQDKNFKEDFDDTKKFTTALDTVQKLIKDYSDAGKSTNALKWMAEKVARSMWITTDQALAQLQTQMWFTLAGYIKSISGTAASDAEVQRLMWQMANISNVKDLNDTIVNQVRDNANTSLKSMIDTRMYWMPDDLKYSVFEDVYWKQQTQSNKQQSNIPASLANPSSWVVSQAAKNLLNDL